MLSSAAVRSRAVPNGLLGVAMATGLAIVLRAGAEIPEDYWRSIFDYRASSGRRRSAGSPRVSPRNPPPR